MILRWAKTGPSAKKTGSTNDRNLGQEFSPNFKMAVRQGHQFLISRQKMMKGKNEAKKDDTLSPIIMVQWKMAIFKGLTTIGDTPIFLLNHDYGRKGVRYL